MITLKWRLPVYACYLVVFLLTIYSHESLYHREIEQLAHIAQDQAIIAQQNEPAVEDQTPSLNVTTLADEPVTPKTNDTNDDPAPDDNSQPDQGIRLLQDDDGPLIDHQNQVNIDLDDIKKTDSQLRLFGILNLLCTLASGFNLFFQTYKVGKTYWASQWAYLDLAYTVLNFLLTITILFHLEMMWARIISAILAIVVWSKAFYFLQLIDDIAPMVHIIFKVFSDIRYFVLTLVIAIFAFSNAFYLLGRNQIQFDEITEDEKPPYATLFGSFKYIYMLALGEVGGIDQYEIGTPHHTILLWVLFIMTSFVLILHMLNMLVAIMGNTFANNTEVEAQNKMKSKLRFVIDNWWIDAIGQEKHRICYLVAALFNEEDDEDVEILKDVQEDVWAAIKQRKTTTDLILKELKKVKVRLAAIENQ